MYLREKRVSNYHLLKFSLYCFLYMQFMHIYFSHMHVVQTNMHLFHYNLRYYDGRGCEMRQRSSKSANIVGQRIQRLRIDQGLLQRDLVARIQLLDGDISQSKLSRIEGQLITVTDRDLFVIAQALQVEAGDLFPPCKPNKLTN